MALCNIRTVYSAKHRGYCDTVKYTRNKRETQRDLNQLKAIEARKALRGRQATQVFIVVNRGIHQSSARQTHVQSTLPDFPTRARFAGLRRLLSRNGILVQRELSWRTHTEELFIASRRPK